MGIANGVLYVADLTVVRMFDVKTGAPKGDVAIPGSTFLNDIATGPDGKVYVSDSGLKAGAKDMGQAERHPDAVYVIDKGHAKAIAKEKDLGAPNGLLVTDKGVIVVTFGSGEVYLLDDKGKKQNASKPPGGVLDGVVALGDQLLVSSWETSNHLQGAARRPVRGRARQAEVAGRHRLRHEARSRPRPALSRRHRRSLRPQVALDASPGPRRVDGSSSGRRGALDGRGHRGDAALIATRVKACRRPVDLDTAS